MNNLSALEKEIIKDFNKKFVEEDNYQTGVMRLNGFINPEDVESFILSALRKQREMIVETLMKERKDHSAEKDEDIQVKE